MISIRQRLSKDERKKQIQQVAKCIFLEKGFRNTTMEDIIKASDMSTGGVYHYYKNSLEILYDIMRGGIEYRKKKTESIDLDEDDLKSVSEIMVDRILDENEFKALFAMFLQIRTNDANINKMYEELKVFNNDFMQSVFVDNNVVKKIVQDDFLMALVNSLILGYEILDDKKEFEKNRENIKELIYIYLCKLIKKGDE